MGIVNTRPSEVEAEGYLIHLTFFLNARHRVTFGAQTGPVHSHSWRLELVLRAVFHDAPSQAPVEFAELEKRVRDILRPYEGEYLNDLSPFDRHSPTTENLARLVFGLVSQALSPLGVKALRVSAWEAPTKGVTVRTALPGMAETPRQVSAAQVPDPAREVASAADGRTRSTLRRTQSRGPG